MGTGDGDAAVGARGEAILREAWAIEGCFARERPPGVHDDGPAASSRRARLVSNPNPAKGRLQPAQQASHSP